jgi:hypothetical protein
VIFNLLTGRTFGRWTVGSPIQKKGKPLRYACTCTCGSVQNVLPGNLLGGASGGCRSCGGRLRPFESEYNRACRNIRRAGQPMKLSYKDFVGYTKITLCHYCKNAVTWIAYPNRNWRGGYNLDRKDSSIGYTKTNVVVCCKICNFTKANRFTYEEFLLIAKVLRQIQRRRQLDKDH